LTQLVAKTGTSSLARYRIFCENRTLPRDRIKRIRKGFSPKPTVVVWVKDKCYVFHTAICEALLPVDSQVFEALACCIKVINGNTYSTISIIPKLRVENIQI
jgi:hypothetical protein